MSNLLTPLPATEAAARDRTLFLTVAAKPREPADVLFSQLATALKQADATIVALFIYGDVAARAQTTKTMRRYLGAIDWPVLWVEGRSCNGALLAGVQTFAVRGAEVERLLVKGRVVGTIFEDADARHCVLAGMGPDDPSGRRDAQTAETFENIRAALEHGGFEFRDIARTWFYNEKLLDWYEDFNRVRTGYYTERPFRSGAVPASTGVEARNPHGAALGVAAWAVQPLTSAGCVSEVVSPLQCAAQRYGSSFSRAMEIVSGGSRRLFVSGTASIGADGRTVCHGDVMEQVATTMNVIGAILSSRRMSFTDVTRATAYFKYPLDAAALETWQDDHGIRVPAVYVHCDICRDDLLFELELDAVVNA